MQSFFKSFSELKELLDSYSSHLLGKYPHKYLIFNLQSKCNLPLKALLEEAGYWKFAPSFSQKLVAYHSIVNFFFNKKGIPDGDGDRLESHHLSGNNLDNRPTNLVYVSPADHSLITKYQRRLSKLKLKIFTKLQPNHPAHLRTTYNRRGRLIKNWAAFIMSIICLTVSLTVGWLNRLPQVPIKKLIHLVSNFLKRIHLPTTPPPHATSSV